jgi:hypothetical protein
VVGCAWSDVPSINSHSPPSAATRTIELRAGRRNDRVCDPSPESISPKRVHDARYTSLTAINKDGDLKVPGRGHGVMDLVPYLSPTLLTDDVG